MKSQRFLLFLIGGFILALILAIHLSQSVLAQDICGYDPQTKAPIPCQKKKNYLNTPKPGFATRTPTPTATDTPPAPKPGASNSTTAGSLFLISQGSGGGCQNNLNPGPNTDQSSPGGNTLFPWMLGGGGLLAGILIGLLLPAVQRAWTGPVTRVRESADSPTPALFHKETDAGGGVFIKGEDAGGDGGGIIAGNIISGNNTFDKKTSDPAYKEDKWAKAGSGKGDDWAKAEDPGYKEDKWIKGEGAQDPGYKEDKWTKGSGPQDSHLNGDG